MANYTLPTVVEKRVRYFDGQYLQDQDFIDEQNYQLDREHRHNRLLHGPGIAEGLAVTSTELNKVTVAPGTAIDSNGYQLVLAKATDVHLPATDFNDKQGIALYISYWQIPDNLQQETPKGSEDFKRWSELPQLTALAPGQAWSDLAWGDQAWSGSAPPPVLLAKLALDASGRVTVDNTVRAYSGLCLPPYGPDATMRATSDGQVELVGSLTVDGRIGPERKPQDSYFLAVRDLKPGPGRITHFSVRGDGFVAINGNVGVGTTSPDNKEDWSKVLDVLGAHAKLSVRTPNIDARFMTHDEGYWDSLPGMVIGTRTNHALSLGTSATTHMTITGAGNVGVGTKNPQARLEVAGVGGRSVDLRVNGCLQSNNNDGGLWVTQDRFVGGHDTDKIGLYNGGGFKLTVLNNGNVGIGTTSPGARLEVSGVGGRSVDLRVNGCLQSNNNDGGLWVTQDRFVGGHDTDKIGLYNGGGFKLTVLNNGNVGIGTTSPGARLEVSGVGARTVDLLVNGRMRSSSSDGGLWVGPGEDRFFGGHDEDQIGIFNGGWRLNVKKNGSTEIKDDLFVKGRLLFWWEPDKVWRRIENAAGNNAVSPGTTDPPPDPPSDIRLKTDLRPIRRALDGVRQLHGRRYRWGDGALAHFTKDIESSVFAGPSATEAENREVWQAERRRRTRALAGDHIGLIAQNVETVLPELVHADEDGYKHISYQHLTAVLVEAIKEQDAVVQALSAKIAALQAGRDRRAV